MYNHLKSKCNFVIHGVMETTSQISISATSIVQDFTLFCQKFPLCVCVCVYSQSQKFSQDYLVILLTDLFCFWPSTNLFSPSQYCDHHKRCSLGGLYTQSLADNIYICENILKAQKDGMQKRKWNSHTLQLCETKRK